MTTPRLEKTSETSFTDDLLRAVRYYIRGRRGLLIVGSFVLIAGLSLNWRWLVAAGVAPILVSVLPCLAMCALGLCMKGMSGRSCSTESVDQESSGAIAEDAKSTMRNGAIDDLSGEPTDKLTLGSGAATTTNLETQSLKKRNTTDA